MKRNQEPSGPAGPFISRRMLVNLIRRLRSHSHRHDNAESTPIRRTRESDRSAARQGEEEESENEHEDDEEQEEEEEEEGEENIQGIELLRALLGSSREQENGPENDEGDEEDEENSNNNNNNNNVSRNRRNISSPSPSSSSSMQQESSQSIVERADSLRSEGNELFKIKRFELALQKYNRAVGLLDNSLIELRGEMDKKLLQAARTPCLLNRAAANLHLENFERVVSDCDQVLETDPKSVKALFRRGMANFRLNNIEQARRDVRLAHELEPADSAIKKELEEIEKKL